ncbi:MAG: Fic family protein [Bacilli bacterium]|nr:Fic family protein [Bacilli bacterium]
MDNYKYSYLDEKGIYCYKGSDVLINKLNIQDEETFRKAERLYSGMRQSELLNKPIDGDLDFKHLKAIHFYLFQDLFYWAGKIRTVAIAKGNLFCLPQYIESYAKDLFSNLKQDNYYQGLSKEEFVNHITNLLADINALHPFREGNGRTQREFIRYIGIKNGYGFDWSKVSAEENIIASYESVNGDNEKLRAIISKIIYALN